MGMRGKSSERGRNGGNGIRVSDTKGDDDEANKVDDDGSGGKLFACSLAAFGLGVADLVLSLPVVSRLCFLLQFELPTSLYSTECFGDVASF
ncbi:hypothetical protein SUGI_0572370 [Cryptomeria japonica]|nr:hypothetical protein SUGI_0572370 [Cryptomeria japonica]